MCRNGVWSALYVVVECAGCAAMVCGVRRMCRNGVWSALYVNQSIYVLLRNKHYREYQNILTAIYMNKTDLLTYHRNLANGGCY